MTAPALASLAEHLRPDVFDTIDFDTFQYPPLLMATVPQAATINVAVFYGNPAAPSVVVWNQFRPNQVPPLERAVAEFNVDARAAWSALAKAHAEELLTDAEALEAKAATLREKARLLVE